MNADEATKRIREAAAEGKIEFASEEGIESFDDAFVHEFMVECVGVKGYWISDESGLSDFGLKGEAAYAKIEAKYGVDVRGKDTILDILRVIHAANRTKQ